MKPLKDIVLVGIQLVLFLLFVWPPHIYRLHLPTAITGAGFALFVCGSVLLLAGMVGLRSNLTPFPTPLTKGKLIQSGIYQYIRHPIYSGIVAVALGYGVYDAELHRVLCGVLLLALFYYKSAYEEKLLHQKFPEYRKYKENSGRFLPRIRF